MDDFIDSVKKRRSIRKYSSRKVSTDIIRQVLEAAGWAPSAHNAQPWRFIVLTDASQKFKLSEAMADLWVADMTKDGTPLEARENQRKASIERFTQAPVLIIACLTMKNMHRYVDEFRKESERDLAMQSLGAAVQNLLLAAHVKGLGACWFSAPVFCKEIVRSLLKIPNNVEPQALITLGYPAEKPSVPSRKWLETYSYLDYWGEKL